MSDATSTQVAATGRDGFGRNQLIALAVPGVILTGALVLVLTGKLSAAEWVDLAQVLGATSVVSTNGGSAVVKAVQAWRG